MKNLVLGFTFLLLLPLAGRAQQLLNLPVPTDGLRYHTYAELDFQWPATHGAGSVCLWGDDKLAAVSITIDDNNAPDVPFWRQASTDYGWKFNWFLITDRVGGANATFDGTWPFWAGVLAEGHDIQSHTRTHLHVEQPTWPGILAEYAGSKAAIEANLPGHRCDFLAYPGGTYSSYNDQALAAQYYAAARGTTGGSNCPATTDYLNTKSMGVSADIGPTSYWPKMETRGPANIRYSYYRGWAVLLFHTVSDQAAVRTTLDFIKTNESKYWVRTFGQVARYAQERESSTLNVTSVTPTRIDFTLTDRMLDAAFDQPLTVKFRTDGWTTVTATQNGAPVPARLVTNAGATFALVDSVPDRGPVTLTSESGAPVYEGFTYAPTTNVATAPDSPDDAGLLGVTWTGSNDIITPGLTYAGINAAGNALRFSGNVGSVRSIDMAAFPPAAKQVDSDSVTRLGKPGSTLWFMYLMKVEGADPDGTLAAGLNLNGAATGGGVKLRIGDVGTGATWALAKGTTVGSSSIPITVGATVLVAVRIKFVAGANNDEVDLFLNPPLAATPPATPSATLRNLDIGTIDRLEIKGNRTAVIDELSIATDWTEF